MIYIYIDINIYYLYQVRVSVSVLQLLKSCLIYIYKVYSKNNDIYY